MTVEEIKQNLSMSDVLARYGVKVNRNGMCCCPIHHEKHPSMKVFKDGYNCFACGANGDIFSFVQAMEGCSFKDAFISLGGTYERQDNRQARAAVQIGFERKKRIREKSEQDERLFRKYLMGAISLCDWWIDNREPFSEDWCYAQNKLPWLLYVYEEKYLKGEEVEEANVYRRCREIRQRFLTI